MTLVRACAAAVGGYVLGTIPTADIVARSVGGPDLRSSGSGNPGAANAAALMGARAGLVVLVGDVAKGALAGRLGLRFGGPALAQVASTAAVVGHCHPIWNRGGGGKGVATSVGQVLATFPVYFPIDATVALGTAARPGWNRQAFAATAAASGAWIVTASLWAWRRWPNLWGPPVTGALPIGALVSSIVVIERFVSAARGRHC